MSAVVAMLINLYVFATGRRLFAHRQVRERAQRMKLRRMVEHIDEALAHDEYTYKLEMRRRATPTAFYGPEVAEVDNQLDHAIMGLDAYLSAQVRIYGADSERGTLAAKVRQAVLPDGPGAITTLAYIRQNEEVGMMLKRLEDDDLAAAVDGLPELPETIERIGELNERYGALLHRVTSNVEATSEDLEEARTRGHQLLCETVALILAHFADKDDKEGAHELLAPILFQNDTIRQRRRRRRPPTDIDPNTGEELADHAGADEPAGAGADAADAPEAAGRAAAARDTATGSGAAVS